MRTHSNEPVTNDGFMNTNPPVGGVPPRQVSVQTWIDDGERNAPAIPEAHPHCPLSAIRFHKRRAIALSELTKWRTGVLIEGKRSFHLTILIDFLRTYGKISNPPQSNLNTFAAPDPAQPMIALTARRIRAVNLRPAPRSSCTMLLCAPA
jgi:hypothetical protein